LVPFLVSDGTGYRGLLNLCGDAVSGDEDEVGEVTSVAELDAGEVAAE
jgi:hypothetical protein